MSSSQWQSIQILNPVTLNGWGGGGWLLIILVHLSNLSSTFFYIKTGMYILFFRQTGVCSDIYLKKKGALEVMISIILKMQIYCCNPNFRLGIFLDSVEIFKLMLHYSPRLQNQCNCLSISIAQFL